MATHLLAPCPIPQAIEPFKVVLCKKQRAVRRSFTTRTARRCISSTWYVSSLSALIAFTPSGNTGTISTTFVAAWCTMIGDSTHCGRKVLKGGYMDNSDISPRIHPGASLPHDRAFLLRWRLPLKHQVACLVLHRLHRHSLSASPAVASRVS